MRIFKTLGIAVGILSLMLASATPVEAQRRSSSTTVSKARTTTGAKAVKRGIKRIELSNGTGVILRDTINNVFAVEDNGRIIVPFDEGCTYTGSLGEFGYKICKRFNPQSDEVTAMVDRNGNVLIPFDRGYNSIDIKYPRNYKPVFTVDKNVNGKRCMGIISSDLREIIAPERGYSFVSPDYLGSKLPWLAIVEGDYMGVLDMAGHEIISTDRRFELAGIADGELPDGTTVYYIFVQRGSRMGVFDLEGNEILAPEHSLVIFSQGQFKTGNNYQPTGISLDRNNRVVRLTGAQSAPIPVYNSAPVAITDNFPANSGNPTYNINGNVHTSDNGLTRTVTTFNADGSAQSVSQLTCMGCGGRGVCGVCFGRGGRQTRMGYYPCNACGGTGVCRSCHGKGYTTQVGFASADGTNIAYGEDGQVYSAGGSGSSDDNDSRRSERKESASKSSASDNDGVDTKYYEPNMTGEVYRAWCDICHAWDNPHKHIKKK